jgi:predicted sugar kinase
MTELGIVGAGQSSWGPTTYGFLKSDPAFQAKITQSLIQQFDLDPSNIFWTNAANHGATINTLS